MRRHNGSTQRLAGDRFVVKTTSELALGVLVYVPLDVICQHAEEQVRTQAILRMTMNGPNLEIGQASGSGGAVSAPVTLFPIATRTFKLDMQTAELCKHRVKIRLHEQPFE